MKHSNINESRNQRFLRIKSEFDNVREKIFCYFRYATLWAFFSRFINAFMLRNKQNVTRKLVNSDMNTMYNNLLYPFYILYLPLGIKIIPFINIVVSNSNFFLDRSILEQIDVTTRKILNSIIFNTIIYLLYILYYPSFIYEYSLNKSRCTED